MTNLINGKTPEEIKQELQWLAYGCPESEPECDECIHAKICSSLTERDAPCKALALIEHLEAKVPKWISVEERLPETYEDGSADIVLVTDGQFIHMAAYSNEKWYFAECGEMKEPMFYKVTHWMPLPEPPEVNM